MSDSLLMDVLLISALGISVISLAAALLCFSLLRKQAAANIQLFQKLEKSQQMSNNNTVSLGKRLVALEKQLSAMGQGGGSTSRKAPESSSSVVLDESLKDAVSLLNAGLPPEEVARRCGISKAEASLMKLMRAHAQSSVAA